jgi:hypothetical protein
MDTLVRDLQRKGFRIGGHEIGALAFADDVVLLADSNEGAQDHVDHVGHYMNKLRMILNPRKSSSLLITAMTNTWVVRDSGLSIGETMFPGGRPSSVLKYLGVNYTQSEGLECGALIDILVKTVDKARGLVLIPLQMVNQVVERIIPKFLYGLFLGSPNVTRLQMADQKVRAVLKDILHLHPSKIDHVLRARKKGCVYEDCLFGPACPLGESQVAKSMRLIWPVSSRDLVRATQLNKSQESKEWDSLASQCHGAKTSDMSLWRIANSMIRQCCPLVDTLRSQAKQ